MALVPRVMTLGAVETTLSAGIGSGYTLLDVATLTGTWPDTTKGMFMVTIDPDTDSEEQVIIESYTSTQLTVPTGGRGMGGTTAQSHSSGAVVVHTNDPVSMTDVSQHVVDTTRNDHTQYPLLQLGAAGAPSSGTWATGQTILDENGQAWKCTAGGTPGTWVAVGGVYGAYPVGAIYFAAVSTNPATLLNMPGTTWSAIGQGRFFAGVGTGTDHDGNTLTVAEGGTNTSDTVGEYQHTLTSGESGLPAHTHPTTENPHTHATVASIDNGGYSFYADGGDHTIEETSTAGATTGLSVDANTAANASSAHNNVPPLFGLYAWQRTA